MLSSQRSVDVCVYVSVYKCERVCVHVCLS